MGKRGNLPCVVAVVDGSPTLLIRPDDLALCKGSVSELKKIIQHACAIKDLELSLR